MTHRTTFALDEATATRIRELASEWRVSQAEVVRRVVAAAAEKPEPDPLALLAELHRAGDGLSENSANQYLADVRKDRQQWRAR